MGMVATGTTPGGELEKQMLAFFGMPSMDELCVHLKKTQGSLDAAQQKGLQFLQGNSLWCRDAVKDSYVDAFKTTFLNAVTGPLTTCAPINAFIESATNGLIKDMLSSDPTPEDLAWLVNTAYFKGSWAHPFKEERTEVQPFAGSKGASTAPLMWRNFKDTEAKYATEVSCTGVSAEVLVLPYEGGRVVGVFVLPSKAAEYENLVATLKDGKGWSQLHGAARGSNCHAYIPKFKLESDLYDITQLLSRQLPSLTTRGELGRVTDCTNAAVTSVLHKAVVEVNEEGTEAAAATVVMMRCLSMPGMPPTFRCDRSFLFSVYDTEMGLPVFAGAVRDL